MDVAQELDRAKTAARLGDFTKARAILGKIIEQNPRHVEVWLLFSQVAQKPEHAIQCLERVIALDPENETARQRLARFYAPPQTGPISPRQTPLKITIPRQTPPDNLDPALQQVREQFTVQYEQEDEANQEEPVVTPTHSAFSTSTAKIPKVSTPEHNKPKPKSFYHLLEILLIAVIICLIFFLLAGLGYTFTRGFSLFDVQAAKPVATGDEVMNIIYQNIRASNAEDLNAYMATIHPKSPAYETIKEMLLTAFQTYDLFYEITDVKVINQDSAEIQVAYLLTTRKIRGPSFRDNQVSGVMVLRKDNGVWKIFSQQVENIEYLD